MNMILTCACLVDVIANGRSSSLVPLLELAQLAAQFIEISLRTCTNVGEFNFRYERCFAEREL